jgi:cardiolipin synthase (CMP-forming)
VRPPPDVRDNRWLTVPNLLSLGRLATVPVFVWLFVTNREDLAVVIYGLAAFTDFFDGYVARRTDTITELGRVLDPLADRVFIGALAVALVARGLLPPLLAGAVLVRDVVVVGAFLLLERRDEPRLRVNRVGKTATALLLAGLSFLALAATSVIDSALLRTGGLALSVSGAILYWVAAAIYAEKVRVQKRATR